MDYYQESLKVHEQNKGKLEIRSRLPVTNKEELSVAYTPGVAQPCVEIHKNPDDVYKYTSKSHMVAVLTDGSAVLGLGNIGAGASIPVMEGKCVLFKEFADIDAFPIALDTQDADEIVRTAQLIAPVFGGINLEDIGAPRCFEVEGKLQSALDIPVFHDDQHGTAVVVSAAVLNALKVVGKQIGEVKFVISGAGAAGTAVWKMLRDLGAKQFIVCDIGGILYEGREGLRAHEAEIAANTNPHKLAGTLADAMRGADVFIGVSAPDIVSKDMVRSMNKDAVLFPLANPAPEIMPGPALEAGARVVGTGRSDFMNQINNVLAFPGIFKGALQARAKRITPQMKVAAAYAIAGLIADEERSEEYIIPGPFDKRVAQRVAEAVYLAAKADENKV